MSKWGHLGILMCLILSTHTWASVGKVSLLKGDAAASRNNQTIQLATHSPIEEHDMIVTGNDSQIQLIFEDKTVITLGSSSVLNIQEYLNDAQQPKAKFKFNQGTFKSITGEIGKKAPQNFNLETQTATIGIRGTTVAGDKNQVYCQEGSVLVTSRTTGVSVLVPANHITFTPQGAAPTPARPATQQEVQQIHQNLNPPAPRESLPAPQQDDTRQPSGNTPPTLGNAPFNDGGSNPPPSGSGGGGGISPSGSGSGNSNPAPMPQTFMPASAMIATQSNTQNFTQNQMITHTAAQLGITPDILQASMNNTPNSGFPTVPCPAGTTGTYPNCVTPTCPAGTTGTYPNCVTPTCPAGTTGTYPNCVTPTCPAGTTGTYPNCVTPTCPAGTTGTYPNCVTPTCSDGTTGVYPNCYPIVNLSLIGLASSSKDNNGTLVHTIDNQLTTSISNAHASGTLQDGAINITFNSSTVDISQHSLFSITVADSNLTQFSSSTSSVSDLYWGQWTSLSIDSNQTLIPTSNNYWVAGKNTQKIQAATHIGTLHGYQNQFTKYTYLGKALGSVYNASGTVFPILSNDPTNEVKLIFTIGNSAAPIAWPESHIRFTANGYWDIGVYPGQAYALANGSFWAMLSQGTISGDMKGYFYGEDADALGGLFTATNSSTSSTALGALIASKIETNTSVSGLGTSVYEDPSDVKQFSTLDVIDMNLTDFSSASGRSNLHNRGTFFDLNTSTTSMNSFGPSSDYLYWGKWTSSQVDGNQTLIATNDNFWVAGTNTVEASAYISPFINDSRTPVLTYRGNIIGSTYNSAGVRYAIDEDSFNKVVLQFNLGDTYPLDGTKSSIMFQSNDELWTLKPFSSSLTINANSSTFTASFNSDTAHVVGDSDNWNVSSGSLLGSFYGPTANAAGGTFQAFDEHNTTALGVFKTIKTNEFFYPSSFYPYLGDPSTNVGTLQYVGFATSSYLLGGTLQHRSEDTLALNINTTDTLTSGSITFAGGSNTISLDRITADEATMTYIDINNFAIKNFDAHTGWMQTNNSESNDYVSWGYWAINSNDHNVVTSRTHYWVGGTDTNATAAATYINAIATPHTHYIYQGKVLGSVYEGSTSSIIDTASSSVQLKFDFGGGTNALYNDLSGTQYNWIRFSDANGKSWDLRPTLTTPTVTSGTFGDALSGTVTQGGTPTSISSGALKGKFYGTQAQAIGGTFNANTATSTALGVFKAVRP